MEPSAKDIEALRLFLKLQRDYTLFHPVRDKEHLARWLDMTSNGLASRLKAIHPDLTTTEQCLCYLHSLGYNLQQIADILHVEKRSVERYIIRICEKFNIEKNRTSFNKYMLTLKMECVKVCIICLKKCDK